jgi:hypothetical protein
MNAVDVGDGFDYVVMSLAIALRIPYVSASSYAHTWIVERYTASNSACWSCANGCSLSADVRDQVSPLKVLSVTQLRSLIPPSVTVATQNVGSSILVASTAANMAISNWINDRHTGSCPNMVLGDLVQQTSDAFRHERDPACVLCSSLPAFYRLSREEHDLYFFGKISAEYVAQACPATRWEAVGVDTTGQSLSLVQSRMRLQPGGFLVPAIPALDIEGRVCSTECGSVSLVGEPHGHGLIKAESCSEKDVTFPCVTSGARSSLVRDLASRWYRLKGCGPIYEKDDEYKPGVHHLRGCCFQHTAMREQFICKWMKDQNCPFLVGNQALYAWHYGHDQRAFCGVFETVGEKRLEEHFVRALERLLDDRLVRAANRFLNGFSPDAFLQIASDTMFVLGAQVGSILRWMHEHEMVWGYFIDHDMCEPHCNSHPNNLVMIIPNDMLSLQMVAPVDFDMSYRKCEFVSLLDPSEPHDLSLFESWRSSEPFEMRSSLFGSTMNSGVSSADRPPVVYPPNSEAEKQRLQLRSRLVAGFDRAFADSTSEPGFYFSARSLCCASLVSSSANDMVHLVTGVLSAYT